VSAGQRPSIITSLMVAGLAAGPTTLAAFPDGVSSGDVTDTAAILWTRTDRPGQVRFELAVDESFRQVVATGLTYAREEDGLTVHFDVGGLSPSTEYVFRFVSVHQPSQISDIGRFKTAPAPDEDAAFRFVFSGDSDYAYTPLWVMKFAAEEAPDFMIWFGDTIYGDVPSGELGVARTLDEYRAKYRQIRQDEHVRELLRTLPVWVGWDDHEVTNNYSGGSPKPPLTREQILAGYQAFFESMPIRPQAVPDDPYRTYRRMRYGRLAEFFLLDVRQYRDADAEDTCQGELDPYGIFLGRPGPADECFQALLQPRTMLGAEQLVWLEQGLLDSDALVKFIVVSVPMTYMALLPYDRWDGYDAERREILEFIDANRIENVWFLATDMHLNLFNPDLTSYFRRYRPDYVLANGVTMREVVAGPIAAGTPLREAVRLATDMLGLPADSRLLAGVLQGSYEWLRCRLIRLNELAFLDGDRFGYALIEVDPQGRVDVTFRGTAAERRTEQPPLRTTFTTVGSDSPAPVPCFLFPTAVLGLLAGAALLQRAGRH